MGQATKLMGHLNDLYEKIEKCFDILIDECGKEGNIDLNTRMNTKYSSSPIGKFYNADGDNDWDYLYTIARDDGDVIFIFESEVYCTVRDIEPLWLIQLFQEVCLEYGLDPAKIENEVF